LPAGFLQEIFSFFLFFFFTKGFSEPRASELFLKVYFHHLQLLTQLSLLFLYGTEVRDEHGGPVKSLVQKCGKARMICALLKVRPCQADAGCPEGLWELSLQTCCGR